MQIIGSATSAVALAAAERLVLAVVVRPVQEHAARHAPGPGRLDLAPQLYGLVEAAREAVQQWRYEPTLLNGNPVEVITEIQVNFTLTR